MLIPQRESFQVNIKNYIEKANYYWVITICLGKRLLSSLLTLSLRSLETFNKQLDVCKARTALTPNLKEHKSFHF